MADILSKDELEQLASKIVENADGKDDLPDGVEVVHMDFEILSISDLAMIEGRFGVFYRFTFDYKLEALRSDDLLDEEAEKPQSYRRKVRLNEQGNITGYSEREEIG